MKRSYTLPMGPLLPGGLKESPLILINEISQIMRARLREGGGEMSQESVLLLIINLFKQDGVTQLSLVKETHLRPSTVSVTLSRLETLGYIRRETHPNDLRAVKVFLTDKGRELYSNSFLRLRAVYETLMKEITADEVRVLTTLLTKMRDNMLGSINMWEES